MNTALWKRGRDRTPTLAAVRSLIVVGSLALASTERLNEPLHPCGPPRRPGRGLPRAEYRQGPRDSTADVRPEPLPAR